MSAISQIANRHFGRNVLVALARKGIAIVGTQAAPAYDGDRVNSGRAYQIDDNGTMRIRSFSEVLSLAER